MIVLLNPVFNCSRSLLSFSADQVTTGTYNLQSVILKVAFVGLLISSTADQHQDHHLFTSQLINGIPNVLQKLLKCSNATTILTSAFSALLPSNFSVKLVL